MQANLAVVALSGALLATSVGAQPVMGSGTRVRAWFPDTAVPSVSRDRLVSQAGRVESMDTRVIVLRVDGGATHRVSLATLVRLDSSAGRSTHRLSGAIVGGLLSGAAFVGMVCGFSSGSCAVDGDNIGGFLGYYAIGAIPGIFIGRAVGGRMQGAEQWRIVWKP